MTLKKILLCGGAAAFAATATIAAPSAGQAEVTEPVDLSVASFSQRSSWYAYAVGLANMLRDVLPEGSVIDTPPEGGGTSNALLVSADRVDLGFGMAAVAKWAEAGSVVYDEPVTNLRALLGGLDQYYLAIAVRGDDQPASLDDYLSANPDLNVALRQKGSAGGEGGIQMLSLAGASPDEIAAAGGSLERARSFGIIRDLMVANNADLWIHTVTAGHPAMTEVSQTIDVSFPAPSEEVLAAMEAEYGWVPAVMPAGTFRGQDADVTVPGTTSILMVNEEFPEELAYTIVKTVCENTETFQSVHRGLADFTCANAFQPENTIIPLHPGAERYFKEAGLM